MPAGGTFVVCPKSTILQWEGEFARVTKGANKLSVLVHHGASRTIYPEELARADVVLATYGVVRKDRTIIDKVKWFRIVLDEAHTIRNPSSEIAEACRGLGAERRWCISGTPMQGKMEHLDSYLRFVGFTTTNVTSCREKLDVVLKTILLRHTKGEKSLFFLLNMYICVQFCKLILYHQSITHLPREHSSLPIRILLSYVLSMV
jgi:superfamily II DNA or RNA helicase